MKRNMKNLVVGLALLVLCMGTLSAAGKKDAPVTETTNNSAAEAKKVVLTWPVWGTTDLQYYTEINNLKEAYQAYAPNVTIEIEQFKSTDDFENAMKIRFAADEFPDVLGLKPYMLAKWADMLMDLSGQPAVTSSLFPDSGKVGTKVVAVPRHVLNEYVYYSKSLFAKAGVKVPQTWSELIDVSKKLKAAGITPIIIGAKDVWPTYPFTEYMAALETNNGEYWNLMATQDEPFKAGTGINKAYFKFQDLVKAGAFDVNSAIGLGFDQAKLLFAAKKGAMFAAGMWFLPDFKENIGGDMNDLGIFYLPVRDRLSDNLIATAQIDGFMAVPLKAKNPQESIKFINWMLTSDYYKGFINFYKALPTVKGVALDEKFFDNAPKNVLGGPLTFTTYDGGNVEYQRIANAVQFDCKRTGQEIIVGSDLNQIFASLNSKWKTAKAQK